MVKKSVNATNMRIAKLKSQLASAKSSHLRLIKVSNRSEAEAKNVCTGLQRSHRRLMDVEPEREADP